jgi:hypothetical protein
MQNGYIGNKKALYYLMSNYCQQQNRDVFEVLPLTFHISKGIEDSEWKRFQSVFQQLE